MHAALYIGSGKNSQKNIQFADKRVSFRPQVYNLFNSAAAEAWHHQRALVFS